MGNHHGNGTNGNKLTRHHLVPRSRGGGNGDNVVYIPEHRHVSWHAFFGNLTPMEAIEYIELVFMGKKRAKIKRKWTHEDLYRLQIQLQENALKQKRRNEKILKVSR
ncbi:MAG: hypothetical protein U9Q72_01640 [Patescibacteria group bacterium]|nr:hypothetical protein [Patescibacteria group bacterium]